MSNEAKDIIGQVRIKMRILQERVQVAGKQNFIERIAYILDAAKGYCDEVLVLLDQALAKHKQQEEEIERLKKEYEFAKKYVQTKDKVLLAEINRIKAEQVLAEKRITELQADLSAWMDKVIEENIQKVHEENKKRIADQQTEILLRDDQKKIYQAEIKELIDIRDNQQAEIEKLKRELAAFREYFQSI